MKIAFYLTAFFLGLGAACGPVATVDVASPADSTTAPAALQSTPLPVLPGIYRFVGSDMSEVLNKRVAVVANHTSMIGTVHLVDTLLSGGFRIQRIFSPEHGFRGNMADGATINDQTDARTGLSIVSLYGKNKKPTATQLSDVDVVIFDIQDVGVRFYTFLSTLHYVMEACAENGVQLLVLDRPNPNLHYVDGPVLEAAHASFVGLHPVPVVYGMSIGEYAMMINGEGWLNNGVACNLRVIECLHYSRSSIYNLPIAPSPNLGGMHAVYLYPSLCLFEGTTVSVGRGTPHPFTVVGEPFNASGDYTFTPQPIAGVSDHPPHKGVLCRGYDLSASIDLLHPPDTLNVEWLVRMYKESNNKEAFFLKSGFFEKIAGTSNLRRDIVAGKSAATIRASWQPALTRFKEIRSKYLIYN